MKKIFLLFLFVGLCGGVVMFGQSGGTPTGTGIDPRTQLKKGSTTTKQFLATDTVNATGALTYQDFAPEVMRVVNAAGLGNIVVAATPPLTSTYNSGTKTYTVAAPNASLSQRGLMFDSTQYLQKILTAANNSISIGGTWLNPTISSPDQTVSWNSSTGELTLQRNTTTAQVINITGTVSVRSSDLTLTNSQSSVTFSGMGGYTRYEVFRDGRLLSSDDFTVTSTTTNYVISLTTSGFATEKMWVIGMK